MITELETQISKTERFQLTAADWIDVNDNIEKLGSSIFRVISLPSVEALTSPWRVNRRKWPAFLPECDMLFF